MGELSKSFKILLLVDMVVGFVYGILYVFFPDFIYSTNDAPFYDPHFWRLFGGVILGIGIMVFCALRNGDWNQIKFFVRNTILFLVITVIINLASAAFITRSATNLIFHWLDNILMIVLIVLNGYFYMKEDKK